LKSSGNFTICDEMATDYEHKFGIPFTPYMNMINSEDWQQNARKDWTINKPVRIRYGGRIGWSIKESIYQFASAVSKLNKEGLDIRFEIYSPQAQEIKEEIGKYTGVFAYDMVSRDKLQESLVASDLLLAAYDFDELSKSKAAYSMPTKIVEYMASGTPIILYAPADLAVTKYAKEGQWAYIISEDSETKIIDHLKIIIGSEEMRRRLSHSATLTCRENHDILVQSAKFHKDIVSILS
jgi:glycosyltransferase involved in cell wall biosynthesis